MSSREEKRAKRLENKKRKIEAFLNIAKLNETDNIKKRKVDRHHTPENFNQLVNSADNNGEKNIATTKSVEDDYFTLKQKYREHQNIHNFNPTFRLKRAGQDALLTKSPEDRIPLYLSDIQALLTFCLAGDDAPIIPHRWCTLTNWRKLSNIVCLVIDGIGAEQLIQNKSSCTWIWTELGEDLMEVVSPANYGFTIPDELALVPTSKRMLEKLIKEHGGLESALESLDRKGSVKALFPTASSKKKKEEISNNKVKDESLIDDSKKDNSEDETKKQEDSLRLKLLLSAKQLLIEGYPLPVTGTDIDTTKFVYTKDLYQEVHEKSELFSVDCEMCLTSDGHELTKICVVNEKLEVVYKTLVKPENPIHNHLTRYSGVTAKDLENVTTRLTDVQADLRALLPDDCILVGQSLNFDLKAMKMMHPYIIDTSVIFNITGDRRRKTKLSTLTSLFLDRTIQVGGPDGHCPEEDAIAALELVLLKLKQGYHFGDVLLGGTVPGFEKIYSLDDSFSAIQNTNNKDENGVVVDDEQTNNIKKQEFKRLSIKKFKTVGLSVSSSLQKSYEKHPEFLEGAALKTGESIESVVELGQAAAFQYDMSITHLDFNNYTDTDRMCKVEELCKSMYQHTSVNGLFLLICSGGQGNNAVAAARVLKAPL